MDEKEYIEETPIEHRKRFAQFFTPERVSDFMASWVVNDRDGHLEILDPAFGMGILAKSLLKLNSHISVIGYDADNVICEHARQGLAKTGDNVRIINEDYITASWEDRFDGIICNPPYLKFHDYDNSALVPLVNEKLHARLSRFTNLYALFILKSISQMKHGCRMAYIVPSEFLNSDYGAEVKRLLLRSGALRHIIIIDFSQCVFDDALTTTCILLFENNTDSDIVRFSTVNSIDDLSRSLTEYREFKASQLNPEVKWKQYYEGSKSSGYHNLVPFSTFAKVSRGIATGANDYFALKLSRAKALNIPDSALRKCICHAVDVDKLIFTEKDFEKLVADDKKTLLFDGLADEDNPYVKEYIRDGERQKIDKKYLTASRKPWYGIENRPPSPIWVNVFNRNGLRFVRNKTNAYSLTTFHCVYNTGMIDTDILFAYLVTDVAKEIFSDNARQYADGLTKFEPNDLNKGSIFDLRTLTKEENDFVLKAYSLLPDPGEAKALAIRALNRFFKDKCLGKTVDLNDYQEILSNDERQR